MSGAFGRCRFVPVGLVCLKTVDLGHRVVLLLRRRGPTYSSSVPDSVFLDNVLDSLQVNTRRLSVTPAESVEMVNDRLV